MKNSLLILLILTVALFTQSCGVFYQDKYVRVFNYFDKNEKIYPKEITYLKKIDNRYFALASKDSLFILDKSDLYGKFSIKEVNSIILWNNDFLIGTYNGLFLLSSNMKIQTIDLPAINKHPNITALIRTENDVWIASEGVGLYKFKNIDSIEPVASTPVINCLTQTSDSSIWAGSNTGLLRYFPNGTSVRYSEEIPHEGIAILDNDVRHLQIDANKNLWLLMSNAISAFSPEQLENRSSDHVDPLTFDFIADADNSVYKIFDIKDKSKKVIFSEKGIFLLADVDVHSEHDHSEKHENINNDKIKKLEYLKLDDNSIIKINKILDCEFDMESNLIVSTNNAIYIIPNTIFN